MVRLEDLFIQKMADAAPWASAFLRSQMTTGAGPEAREAALSRWSDFFVGAVASVEGPASQVLPEGPPALASLLTALGDKQRRVRKAALRALRAVHDELDVWWPLARADLRPLREQGRAFLVGLLAAEDRIRRDPEAAPAEAARLLAAAAAAPLVPTEAAACAAATPVTPSPGRRGKTPRGARREEPGGAAEGGPASLAHLFAGELVRAAARADVAEATTLLTALSFEAGDGPGTDALLPGAAADALVALFSRGTPAPDAELACGLLAAAGEAHAAALLPLALAPGAPAPLRAAAAAALDDEIAAALGDTGLDAAVSALLAASGKDGSEEVREAAAAALRRLSLGPGLLARRLRAAAGSAGEPVPQTSVKRRKAAASLQDDSSKPLAGGVVWVGAVVAASCAGASLSAPAGSR